MSKATKRILIISAHADDETLGMGGTILKLQEEGHELYWLIVTRIWEPRWTRERCQRREQDIDRVIEKYAFREVIRWDYKDNLLDSYATDELQAALIKVLDRIKPATVFSTGPWDVNFEHRLLFELVEGSTRPYYTRYLRELYVYEVPSSTDWACKSVRAFAANYYVDISRFLERKKQLCSLYSTEMYEFPHPRSEKAIEVLAQARGLEIGLPCAEAFVLVRGVDACA
jgi:LmbE family N-acetylglucosaminyl deacetylase